MHQIYIVLEYKNQSIVIAFVQIFPSYIKEITLEGLFRLRKDLFTGVQDNLIGLGTINFAEIGTFYHFDDK